MKARTGDDDGSGANPLRPTPSRLLRTTALRVSLGYAALFTLVTAAALGAVYWSASQYIDSQIRIGLTNEMTDLANYAQGQPLGKLVENIDKHATVGTANRRFYILVSPDGRKLAGNLREWPGSVTDDGKVRNVWLDYALVPGRAPEEDEFVTGIARRLPDGRRLFIGQGIERAEDLTEYTLDAILIVLGATALIAVGIAIQMGRTMQARLDRISGTLGAIMHGDLSRRLPLSRRNDEFDELARRINEMLTRVEQLMKGMRQVTDNVAHDLRSPLNRLRSRLEVTLLRPREEHAYREVIQEGVDEIEGLLRTFNAILRIAQAEAGSYEIAGAAIDLAALASDMVELYQAPAEDRLQSLKLGRPAENVWISGERDLLAQALGNLLENAIKFAPQGGAIEVTVGQDEAAAWVRVADNGPGIPADAREAVFERFTRLDPARTLPGNGLGLSLVQAIARIHEARVELSDNSPGLIVELRFRRGPPPTA